MKGQVLNLVSSHQAHLLHATLYEIRTEDDGEGCFTGHGLYAAREAAEFDLVKVKQQHPLAVLVQHTYFLDPTNQHDLAMYQRLRRLQERKAKAERSAAQKGR